MTRLSPSCKSTRDEVNEQCYSSGRDEVIYSLLSEFGHKVMLLLKQKSVNLLQDKICKVTNLENSFFDLCYASIWSTMLYFAAPMFLFGIWEELELCSYGPVATTWYIFKEASEQGFQVDGIRHGFESLWHSSRRSGLDFSKQIRRCMVSS